MVVSMKGTTGRYGRRNPGFKQKTLQWLWYLPGAVILTYGLWLSLTYR